LRLFEKRGVGAPTVNSWQIKEAKKHAVPYNLDLLSRCLEKEQHILPNGREQWRFTTVESNISPGTHPREGIV